jgi:hypothetical protein
MVVFSSAKSPIYPSTNSSSIISSSSSLSTAALAISSSVIFYAIFYFSGYSSAIVINKPLFWLLSRGLVFLLLLNWVYFCNFWISVVSFFGGDWISSSIGMNPDFLNSLLILFSSILLGYPLWPQLNWTRWPLLVIVKSSFKVSSLFC